MDHKTEANLDGEFRRHLQILRPYLCQLLDLDVIDICNAWIQKLSACEENEKALRNKYVFALCYQIAKGVLDEPFVKLPPSGELPMLPDDESSDGSCNEVECVVIDSESAHTKYLFHNRSPSRIHTNSSRFDEHKNKETSCSHCDLNMVGPCEENMYQINRKLNEQPCSSSHLANTNDFDENYNCKANNLIMKLREIRKQNIYLQNELVLLREEAKNKRTVDDSLEDSVLKIDNATITYSLNQNSNTTLTSLKCKLQEVQSSRNSLIETVSCLQDKLDHLDEMKQHEIEEIIAQHKLEIIKLKTSIREEIKDGYESKLNELKIDHEKQIIQIQNDTKEEIENLTQIKDNIIAEKEKELKVKEEEILQLKRQLEDIKNHQVSVLNKFIDYSAENSTESIRYRSHELEKRLSKMERNKNKMVKAYEAKIATLQREKHLAECSLKLQLIKQRTQIVNEVTDENQVVLASALEKLENKYKEIVASMQATAVQRRIQDQMALESLVQAVCGTNENPYASPTSLNTGQFSGKPVRNQNKDKNPSPDREIGALRDGNRIDNAVNKSFGDDSVVTGYCLNSEKLQELFQRVHIPQKDLGDLSK